MRKVIVLVTNDLSHDQRVAKTCAWFMERGDEVTLVGFIKKNSQPLSSPYSSYRLSNPFQRGVFFYAWVQLRLFFFLIQHQADVVWCNDLDTLLPAAWLKRFKRYQLIYDAHECFTESVGLVNARNKRRIWLKIEQYCLPRVDHCITVSQGIQSYYQNRYPQRFHVMRNLPDLDVVPAEMSKPESWERQKILFYHGVFNPHRGLDELMEAMTLMNNVRLILVGYGEHEVVLKDKVNTLGIGDKVHFMGAMSYPNILGLLRHVDLGIALEKPIGESFKWSLPNKIFDYARMGVPFLTLGNPEVKKIMDVYSMGWVVDSLEMQSLASNIQQYLAEIPSKQVAFQKAQRDFLVQNNAKLEWQTLGTIIG